MVLLAVVFDPLQCFLRVGLLLVLPSFLRDPHLFCLKIQFFRKSHLVAVESTFRQVSDNLGLNRCFREFDKDSFQPKLKGGVRKVQLFGENPHSEFTFHVG